MSPIVITLVLLVVAIILFASEKIPVDVVGLLLVMALVLTQVLTMQEAVAGFGNDIIITIGGLFVLVGGLAKTGIVDMVGRRLHRMAGDNVFFLTALIMISAAISASVLKNTTTTAMFLPIIIGLAAKSKIPPSKLLMPLALILVLGLSLGEAFGRKPDNTLRVSVVVEDRGLQAHFLRGDRALADLAVADLPGHRR